MIGMNVIVVHGGAGYLNPRIADERVSVIRNAVSKGYNILSNGGSSLDAVVESVSILEDSGFFNAGRGSVYTVDSMLEFDAAIMHSKYGYAAIGAVPNIKNPIKLARELLKDKIHRFLVGYGAREYAIAKGFKPYDITELTFYRYIDEYLERIKKRGGYGIKLLEAFKHLFKSETVGAVALDSDGYLASAVSTGGIFLKFHGRVGDSAIKGAGLYADNFVAASATGIGEYIIDLMLTERIASYRRRYNLYSACKLAFRDLESRYGIDNAGVIAVDKLGYIAWFHNTMHMPIGYLYDGLDKPIVFTSGSGYAKARRI